MRLGVHTWLQSLILFSFLLFFIFPANAYQTWSKVSFLQNLSKLDNGNNDFDFSQCTIGVVSGVQKDGDESAPRDFYKVSLNDGSIIVDYGSKLEQVVAFQFDGKWTYAERLNFNIPSQYKTPVLNALKNALKNGNCELAGYFASMLANGAEFTDTQGKKHWAYSDGKDGTTCLVEEGATDGTCRRHYVSDELEDGTKRICVFPDGGDGCYEDLSLNDLSKKSDKKQDDNTGNSGQGENNGSGNSKPTDDNKGTPGGSDSGTGQDGQGTHNQGGDNAGTGDGNGDSSGNGKGQGSGDKEGDGKDEGQVDIFEAPEMKEVFQGLRDKLQDKLLKQFEINGGECPKPSLSLIGRSFTVDMHCQILESLRGYFSSLMMFLYTFVAIRIILSS